MSKGIISAKKTTCPPTLRTLALLQAGTAAEKRRRWQQKFTACVKKMRCINMRWGGRKSKSERREPPFYRRTLIYSIELIDVGKVMGALGGDGPGLPSITLAIITHNRRFPLLTIISSRLFSLMPLLSCLLMRCRSLSHNRSCPSAIHG
ncbi:hypothetical protein KCP77_05135 [Salmonella enterica subsp. enterica]|nr:hypothetical protein KCP77_05135 [Salmonella enterica subsp. enterica]